MTKETSLVLAILVRCICVVACVAGAVYLIVNNKEGWGWLVLLAFCSIPGGIEYTTKRSGENG